MSRPRLHLADLADDSKLHGIIDQLVTDERVYWKFCRRILKLQLRHQELASEDAFLALLDIEEVVNERMNFMLLTVARWAFNEGRRSR